MIRPSVSESLDSLHTLRTHGDLVLRGGGNQGCRLFLGYIQSNWKDEKWQRHESPRRVAADSEHIITHVPGERAAVFPGRALAATCCKPIRFTGKLRIVYVSQGVKLTSGWLYSVFFASVCVAFPLQKEKMVPGRTPAESEEHYKLINRVKLNHCQGFDGTL